MRIKWSAGISALSLLLTLIINTPIAQAAVPQAPGYSKATFKVIVDNDYAAFMGDATNATRLFYQNNYQWNTQIANATSIDIFPQTGETYIYIAVMGGGGTEDWAGKLNGIDVVDIPGAQVASGRSPSGGATVNSPYVLLQGFVSGYNATNVANGVQDVTLAQIQTALSGASWTSAVSTGYGASGNVPTYKTLGVCCGSEATGAGMTGKGWNFPSNSLVVFRYPLSSLGLPVRPGNSQVVVDWDAPAAGDAPTGYIVQYKKSSDPDSAYTTFSNPMASTTVDTVTGLTNGIFYSFRVAATNASGTGPYSAVREAMPIGPPPAPSNLAPMPKASSVEIAFTNPISDGGSAITNYEYSTNGGGAWSALSPVDSTTPVTITGLTDGLSYTISIRAVNSYGSGAAAATTVSIPGLVGRLSNFVIPASLYKGLSANISVSLNIPGKVTFYVDGKKIAGCIKVSSSGSSPTISATCSWKPAVMGRHFLTAENMPADNAYATGFLNSSPFFVQKRTNTR